MSLGWMCDGRESKLNCQLVSPNLFHPGSASQKFHAPRSALLSQLWTSATPYSLTGPYKGTFSPIFDTYFGAVPQNLLADGEILGPSNDR